MVPREVAIKIHCKRIKNAKYLKIHRESETPMFRPSEIKSELSVPIISCRATIEFLLVNSGTEVDQSCTTESWSE